MSIVKGLKALTKYNQFIMYRKEDKRPINPITKNPVGHMNNAVWLPYEEVAKRVDYDEFGIGFILTKDDPFFCIDIDNCRDLEGRLSEYAQFLCSRFAKCTIEISLSGNGVHIWGLTSNSIGNVTTNHSELYSSDRYMALTERMIRHTDMEMDYRDMLEAIYK